jgi:DNA repair protein RecO (recombination protein O)
MIVTTEAVVLTSRKHGETSKIVWLYTKEFGKVSVIAKGARELKSKFGGALEMFAHSAVTFYKKEHGEGLYLLSKAEIVATHRGILESLDAMESGTEIIEILIRAMHDEEKHEEIFTLVIETLAAIASSPLAARALLVRFYLHFARAFGFGVIAKIEDNPSAQLGYRFHHATGEIHQYRSSDYTPGAAELSNGAVMTLQRIASESLSAAMSVRMSDAVRNELRSLFHTYFAHHFAGFSSRSLRSTNVFLSLSRKP